MFFCLVQKKLSDYPLSSACRSGRGWIVFLRVSVAMDGYSEARIIQGIIVGIGFIGGGAIVTETDKVRGTASAAGIWNTGAIGLAVAFGRFEIAIVLSLINLFTLIVFPKVKETVE